MGLLNSPILEVAIGIVLIYLVIALVCTSANEFVAQAFNLRAETLWNAIRSMLFDTENTQAKALYDHPLIRALSVREVTVDQSAKPSYIPSDVFSLAVLDLIKRPSTPKPEEGKVEVPQDESAPATLVEALKRSNLNDDTKRALTPLIEAAGDDIDQARCNIEKWFDATMDRASGWYKQKVQRITFVIAFLIAFTLNADTISIAAQLWTTPSVRTALANAGSKVVAENIKPESHPELTPEQQGMGTTGQTTTTGGTAGTTGTTGTTTSTTTGSTETEATKPENPITISDEVRNDVGLLLGWSGPLTADSLAAYDPKDPRRFPQGAEWLLKLIGLAITAAAATLGAPFWFGLLQKLVNIRAAGPNPAEVEKGREPAGANRIATQTKETK